MFFDDMFRTIAVLCVVIAPVFGLWEPGLKVRFGPNLTGNGTTVFIPLPLSNSSAIEAGWLRTPRPEGLTTMTSLDLWCLSTDYTTCVFIDDTGYIAGLQIALDTELFYQEILDWKTQGFTYWTTEINGVTKNYWTAQQYYVTPAFLELDPATRIANRDPNLLLQDDYILVSGFNGNLLSISTDVRDITGDGSDFTKQACIPMMGLHYYYKMTENLRCGADTILPWFTLIDNENDQLIGAGLAVFTKYNTPLNSRNWFEISNRQILKGTVPYGPECMYQMSDDAGLISLHTFFIKHPYDLKC